MSQARIAADLTNDGILYALGGSLAFLAAAVIIDPQLRKSAIGKSLIIVDAGLSAIYLPSVLHRFAGVSVTMAWFSWYYLASIVAVGTGTWWRTVLMILVQVRGRIGTRNPAGNPASKGEEP